MGIARDRAGTRLAIALIALALTLRVLIAPGFMPVATASGGIVLSICTGHGPAEITVPGKAPQPANNAHDPCPYGALAAAPMTPEAPLLAGGAALPPSIRLAWPRVERPHLGVPAPPPPATGPPLLA